MTVEKPDDGQGLEVPPSPGVEQRVAKMQLSELKRIREVCRDSYFALRELEEPIERILLQERTVLSVRRDALESQARVGDQVIELKIEEVAGPYGDPEPGFFIRNTAFKDESEKPSLRECPGTLVRATEQQVEEFAVAYGAEFPEAVHRVRKFLPILQEYPVYLLQTGDRFVGFAAVSPTEHGGGFIAELGTLPSMEGKGVGTAILRNLQTLYTRLRLMPIPFGRGNADKQRERLRGFYMANGFAGATGWSPEVVSLDDVRKAGDWQQATSGSIAMGETKPSPSDVFRSMLQQYVIDPQKQGRLPAKVLPLLEQWAKARAEFMANERAVAEAERS